MTEKKSKKWKEYSFHLFHILIFLKLILFPFLLREFEIGFEHSATWNAGHRANNFNMAFFSFFLNFFYGFLNYSNVFTEALMQIHFLWINKVYLIMFILQDKKHPENWFLLLMFDVSHQSIFWFCFFVKLTKNKQSAVLFLYFLLRK